MSDTPQGWECPKCHAVFSPTTPQCLSCPAAVAMVPTITITPCVHDYGDPQIPTTTAGRFCRKCGASEFFAYNTNTCESICNLDGRSKVDYVFAHERPSSFTVYGERFPSTPEVHA